jgi:hypothetical protein
LYSYYAFTITMLLVSLSMLNSSIVFYIAFGATNP